MSQARVLQQASSNTYKAHLRPGNNAKIRIKVYIHVTSKQSLANRKAAVLETIREISQRISKQLYKMHMLMSVLSAHAFGDVYLHLGHGTHISMGSGCSLTARLTACALNANAADTMAWHPYNTVVDTILQVMPCASHRLHILMYRPTGTQS